LAPWSSATPRSRDDGLYAGCRGFVGPFPLPLWMSGIQLSVRAKARCLANTVRHGDRTVPWWRLHITGAGARWNK
jgi:hypothetical protein